MDELLRCFEPTHRSFSTDKAWDACQFAAHAEAEGLYQVAKSWPVKVARGSTVDEIVMDEIRTGEQRDDDAIAGVFDRYLREYNVASFDWEKDVSAAIEQVRLFEREVLPGLPPVYATQLELHWDLDGVPYHAHLDLVYMDASFEDLKAPDQRLGENRVDGDVQLTTYAHAIYSHFGVVPPRVGLLGLVNATMPDDVAAVRGIAKKDRPRPWVDRQSSTRTLAQLNAWADDARRREAGRRFADTTGIYQTQGRTNPYACNGCPAKSLCPSWQGYDVLETGGMSVRAA